jgi:hypothetical protein
MTFFIKIIIVALISFASPGLLLAQGMKSKAHQGYFP